MSFAGHLKNYWESFKGILWAATRKLTSKEPAARDADHAPTTDVDVTLEQPTPTTAKVRETAAAEPATQQQLEKTEKQMETRMSAFERTTIRLTRAGIIIGAVTLFIFSGQLYEMRDAGSQADKIIAADDRIARAMEKSVGEANASLSATQESFRGDQRAWIGPISGTFTLDEKHSLRVDVIFQNTGKTPALDVSSILDWKETTPGPLDLKYSPSVKHLGRGTVYPAGKEGMFAASPEILTPQELTKLRTGQKIFYFFGDIDYKDVFGRKHSSHFCDIVNTDLTTVHQCDRDNEAD